MLIRLWLYKNLDYELNYRLIAVDLSRPKK